MSEIWVLGAAGRTGRAIANRLRGHDLVLIGRDGNRLAEVAAETGGRPLVTHDVAASLASAQPKVVVNTIGRPLLDGGYHYLDLANDVKTIGTVLSRHEEASAAGRTLVTGAGFGVLAVEAAVLHLCEGRSRPSHVRVDALAMIDPVPGPVGEALATTLLDALAAGGRRYSGGRLVPARLGSNYARLSMPDGTTAETVGVPTGDLIAAQRASAAPSVIAANAEVPTALAVRAVLPAIAALLSVPAVSRFAKRRLAATAIPLKPPTRRHSYARAQATWPDGVTREAWLEAPEGMQFTTAVAAEVARRLATDEGKPGAYTPGALFGPSLAEVAGGRFL